MRFFFSSFNLMLSQRGHCLKVGNLALFQLCICRFKYHLYANDSKFRILSQNAATELQTRVAAAYGVAPMWTSSWRLQLKESRASLMVAPPHHPLLLSRLVSSQSVEVLGT